MASLYLVPTPIGNLGDITLRALETLRKVDAVLAEDTRNTGHLLKHYEIDQKLVAFHAHNEHRMLEKVISRLEQGQTMALVTDAGTPGISDPGFLLARACAEKEIKVESLPGATAFVPALVNSGLPCDRFCFEGFLPPKKGRQTRLKELAEEKRTTVFYESPHRIVKTLGQLAEYFGEDREASISREITKMYEETLRGTLQSLRAHFETKPPKGEFVLVVAGA
jgi:16S rRNA (cytidine1402-2'-O)-methyltransferase